MKYREFLGASLFALFAACGAIVPAQAQSISQALAAAYDHAPDLQAALINAKSSAEKIVQAKSGMMPNISASVSGAYRTSLTNGSWTPGALPLSASLDYSQNIFDSGATTAQIEAARAGVEVAELQIRTTEQTVLYQVIQAYINVLGGREMLALREENIRFFQAQLQSARDRLEVGEGTRIDVAQAEARLAQVQAAYQATLGSLQSAEATFQRLVGARPQGLSTGHNYGNLIPRSLDAAISEAEAGHPGILLAKASIRAAQAGVDLALAGFGPTAGISGSLGSSWTGPAGGSQDGISAQVGFRISVPIYSGGRTGSAVRQANFGQIKSEVDAMSAYDQVREAVIAAWAGIQSADAQISAAQAGVSSSDTVLAGVIQERDLGTRTTLDVLNAQADLTSAKESLITASNNKVLATFSLLSALGRLTAADLGLPVQVKTALPYSQAVEDVWQELRTVAE
ncbi:TolC family outer membrane protein [Devosia sp. YIM 151766]|uniref:TolC family outer membrane protein n=1 Tax=Devosia sp. YIM 151766 TaxID=3017325 RepID=UPI00255C47B3|nr:TolC family outer membrane protein [Devosia sp. YIM 151766]WIY54180.1 TolC family outer membrane protein [Devosia sp. YIM 151766]